MNKKISINIILLVIGALVNYIITFFLTPYITNNIGIDAYGFVSIAKTFVNYAEILTLALTTFVVRYISVNYHKKNYEEASKYYTSSIYVSIALCILILIVAVIISINLKTILNIPEHLIYQVKILFVLIFVNYILNTIVIPFGSSLYIKNRLDILGIIRIISYFIQTVIMIFLFSVYKPMVWFVGVGMIGTSLITLAGNYYFSKKFTPELKCSPNNFSLTSVLNLFKNGIWSSINQLGNTLNSGLDLIFSNLMLTGLETGQIAIAKSIGSMVGAFEAIIFQSVQPRLIESYSKDSKEDFLETLCKFMKLCGFFSAIIFAGFFSLGKLFFKLWLPLEDINILYLLTLITLINHITDGLMRPVYYVSVLTLKNKLPCLITILGGIINIISMFLLLKYTNLGIYSIVITTAVIMLFINLFFNPRYAAKCLNINSKKMYDTILRHLISIPLLLISFKCIAHIINPTGWAGFIVCLFPMIAIGIIIYIFVSCNNEELHNILLLLKVKVKEKCER